MITNHQLTPHDPEAVTALVLGIALVVCAVVWMIWDLIQTYRGHR